MGTNKAPEVEKIVAVTKEVENSFKPITAGLKNLNKQISSVSNNPVPLQLLSSGFERVIKIFLLLKEKPLTGKHRKQFHCKDKGKESWLHNGRKEL